MSNHVRRSLVAALTVVVGLLLLPATPAPAATDKPDLDVSITSLTPGQLKVGATVTMTGTVTNHDDHPWTNLQAYLVVPPSPFTTRAQMDQALDDGSSYTGPRVAGDGLFDVMGDLAPGASRSFQVRVPYASLGVTGAEGVYPVGVQILGTDDAGDRSPDAIARATTFVPLVSQDTDPVPASIVWPFLMPDHRGADDDYADPRSLLAAVSTGGRLRNLLDLASHTTGRAATVLVDPALLVGVDDLAHERHVPASFDVTPAQQAQATAFLTDLVAFANAESCWVLDYDRPDDLALSLSGALEKPLRAAVDSATATTLATYQLSGRHVSWPTTGGVSAALLRTQRGSGDSPVIVTPGALPGWDRRQGSLVRYSTAGGPMPLLVNDVIDAGVPGQDSVVTLRQRILSEAAFATLQRAIDPRSRADAVAMVDPVWDPGTDWASGQLSAAFSSPLTSGQSLDALLFQQLSTYRGRVARATARPLGQAQLRAAGEIVSKGDALSSVLADRADVDRTLPVDVAGVLGVRWRRDRTQGLAIARARSAQADGALRKITIKGPPSVTLSSAEGGFPLTIRNETAEAVRVGVTLQSSNPALTVPRVKPVEIAAGERYTLTVNVDLGRQNTTTLTARLSSADGRTIGSPAVFNVRSSKIGVALWIAMGVAGVFVLGALVRRFHHRRRSRSEVAASLLVDDE